MNSGKGADMDEEKKPEVLPPEEEKQETAVIKRPNSEVDIGIVVKPSRLPWVNRFTRKNLESFTGVVRAKTELLGAMAEHAKTKGRLTDIEVEIEADRIDRRNRLSESKRKEKLTGKEDKLAELDVDVQIAEKEKRLAELRPTAQVDTEKKSAEDLRKEKIANIRKNQEFKAKEDAIKLYGDFYTRREIEKECERLKQEILKDKTPEDLSEQEKREIEDLEDARDFALEKL